MLIPNIGKYLVLKSEFFFQGKFYWTLLTHMFVHGGMSHIIFNMLGLFFFGPQVEQRMGSWEFLMFYLVCGLFSGIFSLIVYTASAPFIELFGASGAIFAILMAFAIYFPNAKVLLFFVIPMNAKVMVLLYSGLSVFFHITRINGNVGHLTHLAGFGFAFLYFIVRIGINPITAFKDSKNSPWHR